MHLFLSEDQQVFEETARKLLQAHGSIRRSRALIDDALGYDPALLRRGAEAGWFAPLVPEDHGGGSVSGRGLEDLAILAAEWGRVLCPGPLVETNLVAAAVTRAGSPEQRARYLPGLAQGTTLATWAFWEGGDAWAVADVGRTSRAQRSAGCIRLEGSKGLVAFGSSVDLVLLTTVADDGVINLLVPGEDLARLGAGQRTEGLDLTRRLDRLRLNGLEVSSECQLGAAGPPAAALVHDLLLVAAALQAAETAGALEAAYSITLDYARDRKAFGRPIGSFQALKHRLADMALWLESTWAAATASVAAAGEALGEAAGPVDRPAAGAAVAVAQSYIGEMGPRLVRECLQIHGGIGYTWEHDIHLYLRRVEANSFLYGDVDSHRERLARGFGFRVGEGAP